MKPSKDITPNIPANARVAESQDEYQTLYAHVVPGPHGAMCFAVELDKEEIEQLAKTGRLYVNVLTFNNPMQPLFITTDPETVESVISQYEEEAKKYCENIGDSHTGRS